MRNAARAATIISRKKHTTRRPQRERKIARLRSILGSWRLFESAAEMGVGGLKSRMALAGLRFVVGMVDVASV